jgi:hypothetical protein
VIAPGDRVQLERPPGVEVLLHRCAHLAGGELEHAAQRRDTDTPSL